MQYNPRVIDDDDIIGSINLDDKGTAKSYNTISTSIQDPANQFKGRAVTFYDSNYLKADKNVVKSGQINIHSVSNYYNARINVENHLRKSRFGLTISFKIGPKSLLLLAGDTIKITNSKFGFTEKIFRIQNINYAKDCTAQITAEEYDDSFYSISPPTLPSVLSQDQRAGIIGGPPAPTNLSASVIDNVLGGINLGWTNPSGLSAANCFVQIWHHTGTLTDAQIEDNAKVLTELPFPANAHVDQIGKKDVARYYWVRTGKVVTITSGGRNEQKVLYSAFEGPANATTQAPISAYGVSLNGEAFFTSTSGTLSPTSITLVTDRTNSTGNVTYSAVNNSGASVTLTNESNTAVTLTSANFGSATSVTITATLTTTSDERLAGASNTYTFAHTIRKLTGGVQGENAKTVHLTVDDYSIVYDAAGANPSPSGTMTLTATSQGFTNGFFKFTGDGISDESSYTDGSGANVDTFTFSVPSSHFATPKSIRVGVSEGDQTEVAFDTISIFAVKPGATGPAGVDGMTFVNTNPTHTFLASSTGAVSDFTNSGTTFEVYEGATELSFDGVGTSNSTWKVVATTQTNISVGSFTDNGDSVTVGNHSGVASGTDLSKIVYTISGKRADGTAFSVTQEQSFSKSKAGVAGTSAPKTLVSFVYHQASSTTQPSTPSATSYNISTNTFTGLTSGWATTPPTFAAGNANKYWYSYFRAEENTAGGNTSSGSNLTFIAAQQGIGFSGLVTFTSGNTISDGSTTVTPVVGTDIFSSGTTTIDGGKITTGSINLNRLTVTPLTSHQDISGKIDDGDAAADVNSGSVSINANRISLTRGDINAGFTHRQANAPTALIAGETWIDTDDNNKMYVSTGAGNSNWSAVPPNKNTVGLDQVSNSTPANQVSSGWATTITAGALSLGSNTGERIVLDATSSAPRIEIYDGS